MHTSRLPSRRPRLRRPRRLARSPLVFWAAVAALAALTAVFVASALGRAQVLASRYGPLRPTVVASRPVERGSALTRADVEVRDLPAGARPAGTSATAAEVVGRTATAPLVPGAAVLDAHLAPAGMGPVAAALGPGARAVAVPTGGTVPPLRRGDLVDVLATVDAGPAMPVAMDATVVDVGPEAATLAVTPEEARAVAFALANGSLTLAVTPGVRPPQRSPVASSPSTSAPRATR